jgi:hypothetical protein
METYHIPMASAFSVSFPFFQLLMSLSSPFILLPMPLLMLEAPYLLIPCEAAAARHMSVQWG